MARPRRTEKTPVPFSRWRARAALLLLALAAYVNSLGLGLAQDSKAIVTQDPRLQAATAANIQLILGKNYWWPKSGDGLYRPVTTLSLLVNYALLGNGPDPAGYHVVNFLLHAVNVWLLYELALLLLGQSWPALLAAAIWAVHPIGTEAVTGIVGRADLLAAMAVLGGLLLYGTAARRPGWPGTAALFAIATLGVFAKENAAVLIALMLLLDWTLGSRPRWRDYAAVAASLVILAIVRHLVLGSLPVAQPVYVDNPLRGAGFLTARWTAIKVVGLDLWLLLFPVWLSCDRSFSQIALSAGGDPWAWISLAAIGATLAAVVLRYRRDRLPLFAAGFFGIALLPVSNLIFPIGATMAERFLYLPSVGFAVIVAAVLSRWKNAPMLKIAAAALLVLYLGRTVMRNSDWKDDLALASADIETAPRSFRLHDMLAKALFEQDPQRNLDRAIAEEEKSWDIVRSLPPAKSTEYPPAFLGIYYSMKGEYAKAQDVLLRAREISQAQEKAYDMEQLAAGRPLTARSGFPQLYFNLANVYLNLGNFPAAVEALRYGLGLNPHALEAYDGLSIAYSAMGNLQMAAAALEAKALLDGFQPATLAAIRDVYGKMPDGGCAFEGGRLNVACPRVKADLCQASALAAQAFRDSRLAAKPPEFPGIPANCSQN